MTWTILFCSTCAKWHWEAECKCFSESKYTLFFFFFPRERNKIYVDICKNRPGNDRFAEKMMQTINGAAKNKEVQCDKIVMEDKGKHSEHHIGKAI